MEETAAQPMFAELSDEELSLFRSLGSREVCLDAGESLASRVEIASNLLLLLSGELQVTRRGSGEKLGVGIAANTTREGESRAGNASRHRASRPVLLATHQIVAASAVCASCLLEVPADAYLEHVRGMSPANRIIVSTLVQRVQNVETALLQRDKMSTLGKLAAGLTHDLNNPAAAATRSASQLADALASLQTGLLELMSRGLAPDVIARLVECRRQLRERHAERSKHPEAFGEGGLVQAEQEEAVAEWLTARQVADPWSLAPALVDAGIDSSWLDELARDLPPEALSSALGWLCADLAAIGLLREVGESTARISDLVSAVKTYVNMDRAPMQSVDVHEGLENTVSMMSHRLKGIEVVRDYDRSLPRIVANAGELNQVWTNLIDNAADALDGHGRIRLHTLREGDWVIVEVADDGPGIEPQIQTRIFEPFFTTKPGNKGMGLGLDISYRIVTGTHHGDIRVHSAPGDTRFEVCLPVQRRPE